MVLINRKYCLCNFCYKDFFHFLICESFTLDVIYYYIYHNLSYNLVLQNILNYDKIIADQTCGKEVASMDMLKKIFPLSFSFADTIVNLVVGIVIYLVAPALASVVLGLLAKIPLLGIIFAVINWALGIYAFVGLVLLVLVYLKLVK